MGRSVNHDRCPFRTLRVVGTVLARCVSGLLSVVPIPGYDTSPSFCKRPYRVAFVTLLQYYLILVAHLLF